MCGIAGVLDFEISTESENLGRTLRTMLDSIRHRGPDDRGYEFIQGQNGQNLHLGHQRFSIIDLSPGGHQPMSNDDKSIWLSTNSEIYNYRELREELSENFKFQSRSDTEVLLKSYENWGLDCLNKLRGMFAFAIWDSKLKSLILARDRLGKKPLYFLSLKNKFLFASEIRALLASGFSNSQINTTGLYHYLSFGHLKSPNTIIEDIQELQPGHYLTIGQDAKIKIKPYWEPFKFINEPKEQPSPLSSINELLENSVKSRLESDVPIGAFLSGGIDSSAIVSHMSNVSSKPITTLSIGFKEKEFDETEYSKEISRLYKTNHNSIILEDSQLLKTLPAAIDAMDQPTVNGINTYVISAAAQKIGLKVVLSGLGGDELFGGYPSFSMLPQLKKKKRLISLFPKIFTKFISKINKQILPFDKSDKIEHWMEGKLSGAYEYFLIRALFCQDQVYDLILNQEITKREIKKNFESTSNMLNKLETKGDFTLVSYFETVHYLQNMLLRDTDMMSMSFPLEVRVPFMDHNLVEFMFSLPEKYKKITATPKPLLVESLKTFLPNSLVFRKKMGFTMPFELWMRDKFKTEIESVLLSPVQQFNDHISQTAVENIWNKFLNRKTTWSRPWSLYVLKRWLDKNIK